MGRRMSARLSYHTTLSTCSTAAIFSFSAATSFAGIFSTITSENAPLPKSLSSSFWPMTVSISSGK